MENRHPYYLVLGFIVGLFIGILDNKQHSITPNNSKQSFETIVYNELTEVNTQGIDPHYLLAIAILETGHGTGVIYVQTNNLFSIKAEQDYPGHIFYCRGYYRRYESDLSSIKDVVRLISTRQRYSQAYQYALERKPKLFFRALQKAGYSEDKHYAQKLFKIFQSEQATTRVTFDQDYYDSINHNLASQALYYWKYLEYCNFVITKFTGSIRG